MRGTKPMKTYRLFVNVTNGYCLSVQANDLKDAIAKAESKDSRLAKIQEASATAETQQGVSWIFTDTEIERAEIV